MNGFEKLLAALGSANIDFILVGGVAVALAGYVRATEDVDILIHADRENIRQLLGRLEGFGEGAARKLNVEDFTVEEGAVRIVEDFPLDIFTQMSGCTYEDLLPLTDEHDVQDATIRHLSAEGLIRLKQDSPRPRDQLDVQALKDVLRREDRS